MANPDRNPSRRRMRWWIPALLLLAYGGVVVYLRATDDYRRGIMIPVLGAFVLVLVGIWYVFLTGLPWRRRLALGGLGLVLVVATAMVGPRLFRWEGSSNGKATPRLVWRSSESTSPAATNTPVAALPVQETALPGLADFPRYLGPNGDGTVAGVALDPDWSAHPPKLLWRQAIGLGWAGFAVVGRRAVTMEQRGEDELVSCYDVGSGALLWMHTNHVRFSETLGGDGPRATPTIEGGRVFAQGATGLLHCLDLESGDVLWSVDALALAGSGNITWGKCNGPLIDGDQVVVTGGQGAPSLLAVAKADGRKLWSAGTDAASFTSPVIMELAARRQIVSVNAASVTGHEPDTGRLLWTHPWPGAQPKVGQPLAISTNRILISSGYGVGSALLEIRPDANGGLTAEQIWKARSIRNKFSSLVVRDGFAYGLEEETLACLDLENGRRVWKDGKYGFGQLLLAGDFLLIQTEPGDVVLVSADPTAWKELARLPALNSKTWNPPTLAGDVLLVRNDLEVAAYQLPTRSR
jgi:outer membrane protein assembly factor BamB